MGHVFLAGLMGSGKTTLAQTVSQELGIPSYDLDERLSSRGSHGIPTTVDAASWQDFRIREAAELESFAFEPDGIVALGGGTLLSDRAFDLIERLGTSIFLDVPVEELVHRIGVDPTRPLLSQCSTLKEVEEILERLNRDRRKVYEMCNHTLQIISGEPLASTTMRLAEFVRRL